MSKENGAHPLTELAMIAAKAGIGLLPGGGTLTAAFEATQLLSQQLANHMEKRAEMRAEEFITSVFDGDISPELSEHLTPDDYYALLSACTADLENEKAKYYGRMARAIGLGQVAQGHRRFLILALAQISEAQLQMLRRSWIATTHDLRPDRGAGRLDAYTILRLDESYESPGYLDYKDLVAKHMYEERALSAIGSAMTRACFDLEELEPSSVGMIAWRGSLDLIFDGGDVHLIPALTNLAWDQAMRSGNRHVSMLDRPYPGQFISPRVVVIDSVAAPQYLEHLKAKLKTSSVLFVTYQDHDAAIGEVFPDSRIIHAQGLDHHEVAKTVMGVITQSLA